VVLSILQAKGTLDRDVVVPEPATMVQWKAELKPVTERYLEALSVRFAGARATYAKLIMLTGARN
jgi:hypothetical protein